MGSGAYPGFRVAHRDDPGRSLLEIEGLSGRMKHCYQAYISTTSNYYVCRDSGTTTDNKFWWRSMVNGTADWEWNTDGRYSNLMSLDNDGNLRTKGTMVQSTTPDIAENILVSDKTLESGDVVVIDPENKVKVKKCWKPYQTSVVGVITTNPGFLLNAPSDHVETNAMSADGEKPLVLNGRVKVKVTTENGPIKPGDLLTTSSTPGYAMKASIDSLDKIGSVLGKALESLENGHGMIMALINLQ